MSKIMSKIMTPSEAEQHVCRRVYYPHAWIQWKGTDACMDIRCECGSHFHFDGYFAYNYHCLNCDRYYKIDPVVTLIPLTENPSPEGLSMVEGRSED